MNHPFTAPTLEPSPYEACKKKGVPPLRLLLPTTYYYYYYCYYYYYYYDYHYHYYYYWRRFAIPPHPSTWYKVLEDYTRIRKGIGNCKEIGVPWPYGGAKYCPNSIHWGKRLHCGSIAAEYESNLLNFILRFWWPLETLREQIYFIYIVKFMFFMKNFDFS